MAGAFALGGLFTIAMLLLRSGPDLPDQSAYRFSPFSFEPGGQRGGVWSPDGKAIAYAARQRTSDPYQVYVRYLDAAVPIQLTHGTEPSLPIAWTPDSRRIFLVIGADAAGLWSLAAVGGEPELVIAPPKPEDAKLTVTRTSVSPDGKTVVALNDGPEFKVMISSPPGAPFKAYAPAPYATRNVFNEPMIRFSPDGKTLLLVLNAGRQSEEAWLLPYPPDPGSPPKRTLGDLVSYTGTPSVAWMPDNRRFVLSLGAELNAPQQLWMADSASGERHALTSGTTGLYLPAVAPDGRRLIYSEDSGHFDILSLDLETAAVETLIATERNEWMPAWAAGEQALVYVTDRSGPYEIWLHRPGAADRPIVTGRDFAEPTTWFMAPTLSPRADRVIYTRIERGTVARLWISSVAGGAPVPLTNDNVVAEFPGAWSPDGAYFAYVAVREGRLTLMKVKATGQAAPVVLREDSMSRGGLPDWSPTGEWIVDGTDLVSPDGKTRRSIGDRHSPQLAFSKDGRRLYGLRGEKDRQILFSVDVATLSEKIIGSISSDFAPLSNLSPSIRLSLAPDGKHVVYGSGRFKKNLWMLEGFAETRSRFARLFGRP
jgi:Tol biopolymer transport system component